MKITDLKTFVVGNPPPHFGGRYFVFLKLVTDGGVEGVGEVYGVPFHPDVVARMIRDVFERCVAGADPFKIERLWRIVYSSGYSQRPDVSVAGILSGLEMACWDIVGKELDRPVYELLGGRVHERLRSYSYLYPEEGEGTEVYRDPELAAERASRLRPKGLHRGQVRPGRAVLRVRPAPIVARGARPHRALRPHAARSGRQQLRSVVRDPRPDDRGGCGPARAPPRAVRPLVVRGADPARDAGGDGQGRAPDHDPDRDRRAPGDQVRVRARARDRRGRDPADGARPRRRHPRGEEDRRHGRGALRPDRAAPLLRPDRGCRQHPARRLQPELPDPGEHPDLGRLPRRDPEVADRLAGRLRDPAGRALASASSSTRRSRRAIPTPAGTCTSRCTISRSDSAGRESDAARLHRPRQSRRASRPQPSTSRLCRHGARSRARPRKPA